MELIQVRILLPFCAFALAVDVAYSGAADPVALAKKWAPKIYLNSNEEFWPGDVEVFLKQVTLQGQGCQAVKGVPIGAQSQKCFLTTNGKPYDLLKNKNSFLYGTKPTQPVPAYAYVKSCGSPDHVEISYWIFFPFNKGKNMCGLVKSIPILGSEISCKGNHTVVGNHVGDWEHLSIELKNGQPVSLFLSVHDGGVYYNYDQKTKTFTIASQLKEGILKVPHPPQTVGLVDSHPILYCAQGSHAVWAAAGTYSYSRVEMKEMVDVTDQGPEWDTWKTLKVFHSPETTPAWWYYDGRWGNQGSDCVLGKYCIFSDGPNGLSSRPADYKC